MRRLLVPALAAALGLDCPDDRLAGRQRRPRRRASLPGTHRAARRLPARGDRDRPRRDRLARLPRQRRHLPRLAAHRCGRGRHQGRRHAGSRAQARRRRTPLRRGRRLRHRASGRHPHRRGRVVRPRGRLRERRRADPQGRVVHRLRRPPALPARPRRGRCSRGDRHPGAAHRRVGAGHRLRRQRHWHRPGRQGVARGQLGPRRPLSRRPRRPAPRRRSTWETTRSRTATGCCVTGACSTSCATATTRST